MQLLSKTLKVHSNPRKIIRHKLIQTSLHTTTILGPQPPRLTKADPYYLPLRYPPATTRHTSSSPTTTLPPRKNPPIPHAATRKKYQQQPRRNPSHAALSHKLYFSPGLARNACQESARGGGSGGWESIRGGRVAGLPLRTCVRGFAGGAARAAHGFSRGRCFALARARTHTRLYVPRATPAHGCASIGGSPSG